MSISESSVTFSRDPERYEASRHLIQNMKYERKALTPKMITQAIEEGEVIGADRDEGDICVTIRHSWGQMDYEVVLNVESHTVVTACESGRGSPGEWD